MESWRIVWRKGILPQLTRKNLEFLQAGLLADDPRILQGATTSPVPMECVRDWPVEAACLIGYCAVVDHDGFGSAIVKDVEEQFARICFAANCTLGEPAAIRWFLNWADDTPRDEMRREMLAEVNRALANL